MIAGTHDALHDQSQPHCEEESKVLGDPHLLLHHLLALYSHVVYQLSTNHFKKLKDIGLQDPFSMNNNTETQTI